MKDSLFHPISPLIFDHILLYSFLLVLASSPLLMVQGRKVGKAVIITLCAQYYWRVLQPSINLCSKYLYAYLIFIAIWWE